MNYQSTTNFYQISSCLPVQMADFRNVSPSLRPRGEGWGRGAKGHDQSAKQWEEALASTKSGTATGK